MSPYIQKNPNWSVGAWLNDRWLYWIGETSFNDALFMYAAEPTLFEGTPLTGIWAGTTLLCYTFFASCSGDGFIPNKLFVIWPVASLIYFIKLKFYSPTAPFTTYFVFSFTWSFASLAPPTTTSLAALAVSATTWTFYFTPMRALSASCPTLSLTSLSR